MSLEKYLLLFITAALGGAVNSVAGGGTLLTFPALLWVGHTTPLLFWGDQVEKIANATSTVALWPGQLGSLWGYRKEIKESRKAILRLGAPSLIGGALGAYLLLRTPSKTFAHLVPFLILTATLLFLIQEPLSRWQRARSANVDPTARRDDALPTGAWAGVIFFQFLVAIYGGYFGAGIGILMLAALGFMGFTNIHHMNGLKNINGLCINLVAAIIFIVKGLVDWHIALLMASGAILGGYFGAGTARRIGQRNVRRIVIFIGFALTLSLLINH